MIQARELRLGNVIHLKDKGEYTIDCGHDLDELLSWGDVDYANGIPITEDWLLKFGFEKDTYFLSEALKFTNVLFEYNPQLRLWFYKNCSLDIEIKYVHQLQNLYYALTGTELTCKPK